VAEKGDSIAYMLKPEYMINILKNTIVYERYNEWFKTKFKYYWILKYECLKIVIKCVLLK